MMKPKSVGILAVILLSITLLPPATAAPGDLDTGFGNAGIVMTNISSAEFEHASILDLARDGDGKIVAVGYMSSARGEDVLVARLSSAGILDPTFGNGGIVVINLSDPNTFSYERAEAVTLQADGKIVLAGGSGAGFLLIRLNPDGTLDAEFGDSGIVETLIATGPVSSAATSVALDSTGDIVAGGWVSGPGPLDWALARYNPDGSLDPTFDGDGKVVTDFATGHSDIVHGIVVQADDKILATGQSANGTSGFAVARYNTDGSLDNTFDVDGKVRTAFVGEAHARAIALDGTKIVVGGWASFGFGFARYNADGSLDTTFDVDGMTTVSIAAHNSLLNDLAILDGKVVAVGNGLATFSDPGDLAIVRLNSDGSLDSEFDVDGKRLIDVGSLGGNDLAEAVLVDATGILVAVTASLEEITRTGVGKLTSTGALDTEFGDGSLTLLPVAPFVLGSGEQAEDVALDAQGRVVVAGWTSPPCFFSPNSFEGCQINNDFLIARYTAGGVLDPTFGGDGVVVTDLGSDIDFARALALQSDGKILVAGTSGNDFAVARYLLDGTLDSTFDTDGIVRTTVTLDGAGAADLVVQPDGKIIAAGNAHDGGFDNFDFTLVRYNSDGSLDASFDGDGKVITEFANASAINSVKLLPDGDLLAAGTVSDHSVFGDGDAALARYNSDGSPHTSFGSEGKSRVDLTGGDETIHAMDVDAFGRIVLAGSSADLINDTFLEDALLARLTPSGAVDVSFGATGTSSFDVGQSDHIFDVTHDADGRILFASGHDFSGFTVGRYESTGVPDSAFGVAGLVTTTVGLGGFPLALVQGAGFVVLAGVFADQGDDLALVRYSTTAPFTGGGGGGPAPSPTPTPTLSASPSPSASAEPTPSPSPGELTFETELSVRFDERDDEFRGRVHVSSGSILHSTEVGSGSTPCIANREVVLKKVRQGPDRIVGSDRTGSAGRWRVRVGPRAHGRFYAVVKRAELISSTGTTVCARDRSPTIEVR